MGEHDGGLCTIINIQPKTFVIMKDENNFKEIKTTVFDLISEHALISEPPPPFFLN